MSLELTPVALPLLAAAAISLFLARYVWVRRALPGAIPFAAFMAGLAEWSVAYALVIAGTDVGTKMFWYRVEYIGVVSVSMMWVLFIIQYAGWEDALRPWHIGALAVEPLVTLLLASTNQLHGLMWPTAAIHQANGFLALDVTFGTWYWVNVGYGYVLILGASIALALALARRRRLYALQAASLVLGVLAPIAGNALYNAGLVPSLDLAPFAFTLSGVIFWWGLARYHVLDVAPVATPVALESVFEGMVDGVLVVDADGYISKLNPAAAEVLGTSERTAVGTELPSVLFDNLPAEVLKDLTQDARTEIALGEGDVRRDFDLRLSPLKHRSGGLAGRIVALRDITERKRFEEALAHQARHDALTGLPNRTQLRDRLGRACSLASNEGCAVALLFIDLDNFKTINDSLGHAMGDELLVSMAERLRGCLRAGDLAARLGGDEFAVLLVGTADAQAAREVASRIIDALRQPFMLGTAEVVLGASIGIALAGHGAETPGDLLRNADAALYAAKARGKGSFAFFVEDMHIAAQSRLALEAGLRRALAHDELEVYYQPVVDLRTAAITGCEALVRWNDPERGMIPPLDFIPLAEEVGLIVPLGEWVLRQACMALRDWQQSYSDRPTPLVTVNLSPRQLQQPDLLDRVTRVLFETRADPHSLVLEITEGVLLDDTEGTLAVLQGLRQLGLRLAIDDFGTGYSALSYLQRFPIYLLKIDRSFVQGLGTNGERSALVRAILALGQALDLKVVAEGIEREDQLEQLRSLGCNYGQGYFFARPGTRAAFEDLLDRERVGQLGWKQAPVPRLHRVA